MSKPEGGSRLVHALTNADHGRQMPIVLITVLGLLSGTLLAGAAPVRAGHTPAPTSVTLAGDLQSELGCAGDWDPACAVTHLAYDASS